MKAIRTFLNRVAGVERAISAITCFSIVIMVFITVVLRYIFKSQIPGMEEMILTCAFVIYFLGSSVGAFEQTEITADMMTLFLKEGRALNFVKALRSLIETVLMGIASYWCIICMGDAVRMHKVMVVTKIPYTIEYGIVLLGLALTALFSLMHCIDYIGMFIRNEVEEEKNV